MGTDAQKSQVLQDGLGRIFIASRSLLVFDGQTWTAFPKPGEDDLIFLTQGPDGTLWTGTSDNLGFFREDSFGDFKFHSLLAEVPPTALPLGPVWGCAPLGQIIYFISNDKLLRWDGKSFQVTPFPSARRLAPLRIGNEYWFQHTETGLYRLTDTGPEFKFPASDLPGPLIIALFRDEGGLVTVSNDGLCRIGQKPHSPTKLNQYLSEHRVSSFCELPDGNLMIGTLSGGLVLTKRSGEILRIWADANSGLPGRAVLGLAKNASGEVLGTTPTDFFHFSANAENSVFTPLNGLRGKTVNTLVQWQSTLYASTDDGAYRQVSEDGGPAAFQVLPPLSARYYAMLPQGNRMLLARFGGVEEFDGTKVRPALSFQANLALDIVPKRSGQGVYYVAEFRGGISRLTRAPDGQFTSETLLTLPTNPLSLHEAPDGRLWIGTPARGVFIYDPATKQLDSYPVFANDRTGQIRITGDDKRLLFFLNGRIVETDPRGDHPRTLSGVPAVNPALIHRLSPEGDVLVAYERTAATGPLHAAGVLSFAPDGNPRWRELDLTRLDAIGSIRAVTLTEESSGRTLWLGGMEGILRLDYDSIPTLSAPTAPIIKLLGANPGPSGGDIPEFPFNGHLLRFRVFTGDYVHSRNWLFQSRLTRGSKEWSAPAALRYFDYTNLSEGAYQFEVRAINAAGIPGPSATFEFRVMPPWYRSDTAFISYAVASLLAVFGFIRIRERRIQARNEELEGLVNIRTAELVKANAAKDEFLAGISHEIRNPMNGVIGISENFRIDGLDLESRRKFGLLRQCASHLSSLLEDILDFSKVQAGAIELDPKPFDLPELVESVAGITRADSEKYGIPVEVAVSPAVPRKLVGDGRRIRQILINFVSNALKFSGRGQVSVTVWCKELGPAQTEVIFAVSDEGPGISPEEQARLFTRFERGAAAQKGRVPGTGLGLALCKGLAEKMGGKLWLESELGRGSCFYFSAPFPVVEPAADSTAPAAPAAASAGRTALVVDDQEYNRIVLADLLQSMGFSVHAAQEGQAALNAAAGQAFDVVFLDFNLPGLSGVDVARGIRALPGPSAHALILATTAFTTPEKRAQCLDAGMDAFLGKPVTRERLTKALAGLTPSSAPPGPVAAQPVAAKPAPADPLGNLRLLARKKGVSIADELAAYFTDLDAELAQLNSAIDAENADDAGRFSHMICGRCSFIYERDLEQVQRKVEAAIADLQWADARRHNQEFARQVAERRLKLASSGPAAPLA